MHREQIIEELGQIPEPKMAELYDLIHYFRLGLQSEKKKGNPTLSLAGTWSDMPDEQFRFLQDEIPERRRQAFSERPTR